MCSCNWSNLDLDIFCKLISCYFAMSHNLALDLMLRTLMNSPDFRDAENKNWEAVAKLIPGSTSQQCAKRWKEIQQTHLASGASSYSVLSSSSTKNLSSFLNSVLHFTDDKDVNLATNTQGVRQSLRTATTDTNSQGDRNPIREGHERPSDSASYQDIPDSKQRSILRQVPRSARSQGSNIDALQGPNMVIHVCDESKNLKQDFICPRDLLISEMRYFAEYLSVEAQRWEEVDISVHCDIQIFDWLMKYVKQRLHDKSKSGTEEKKPKLEPNNVISILISSDFLKMDALVTECIHFCHENMSAIVATPCNMNCINDKLVTRIAKLFNHNELEAIKDRKDKFKSKLFCKKLEEMFDPRFSSSCSSNASTIFRCIACGKLLTADSQSKLRCVPNRMMVNHRGKVSYVHSRDNSWDVNEYLLGLREEVKSWKEVYWRLWGAVNILYCYRCGNWFPCTDLGHCSYHPMTVDFGSVESTSTKIVGVYPCCQQKVLHFDPSLETSGCCVRDHKPNMSTPLSTTTADNKVSTGEPAKEAAEKEMTTESNEEQGQSTEEQGEPSPLQKEIEHPDTNTADTGIPTTQLPSSRNTASPGEPQVTNNPTVVEDLFAHRNTICVPYRRLSSARSAELNVFGVEEIALASIQVRDLEITSCALSDMIDPSERKVSEFPTYFPFIRRSRSRVLHRNSLRKMKHWRRGSAAFPAWQLCFNACFLSYLFRVGTMTILGQIRTFGFVKLQTRFIQSSASVFHSFQTPSSVEVTFGDKQARCNDESRIFVSKRTSDILRSLFVLKLCSYDFVARNPVKLMSMGQRVFGKTLFEFLLSKTMYRQFVAGENLPAIQDTIKTLHQCGIGTMLCIPNEEDLSSNYNNFSSREEMFDRNTKAILDCIGKTEEGGFSQMKLTAICSPFLLNVLNEHLRPYETTVELPKELSVQTLAEGFHVKIEIPVLSKSQNTHLQNVLKRLDTFAKACINRNVQLVIDAEQTYLQAAINHLVLAAQYKYNKDYPWVYNTYQCYRKDTHDRVKANLELMNKLGFHFGAKIVRGAYMAQERNRAADMGYDDPIHDTYEDTCAMYDDVVYTVLQKVRSTPAEVMVASHNEESVQFVIQRMKEFGIAQDSGKVSFGQLYGMCDQVSYLLGQQGFSVYKSVPYGPVGEALDYLGRRAMENKDVIKRTENERSLLWHELKRRMSPRL